MTTTDGPRVARRTWPDRRPPEAPEHHGLARWRIALKMAMRQSLRSWPSSILVVLLVLLPMAGVAGAATLANSIGPTPEQRVDSELGQADAWVQTTRTTEGMRQYLDDPTSMYSHGETDGTVEPPEDPAPFIDADRLLKIAHGSAVVETQAGQVDMRFVVGDAWDPLIDGRYRLLDGRTPSSGDEMLATPSALERLGAEIGDEVTLGKPAVTATIVGAMSSALEPTEVEMMFAGADGPVSADDGSWGTTWYVDGWHPSAEEVYGLNAEGIVVFDRELALDPGDGGIRFDRSSGTAWALVAAALAALVFSAYLVLLLAGAAFSVSAKRQQRSLAVAASVGASRRDVLRIVLFQGTFLGAAGGLLGAGAGVGLGAIALARLDSGDTLQYAWGLRVPWWAVIGLVVCATVIGTCAALLPARRATAGDTLAALRGGRRPVSVSAIRPKVGVLLIAIGLALVAASVIALVATYNSPLHGTPDSEPVYVAAVIGMIVGPLMLQIGVISAGHWLLSLVARGIARAGVAARLAARDAVANPGRSVPSFGAIAACAFLATAAIGGVATIVSMQADSFETSDPPDSVVVFVGADAEAAGGDPRGTVDVRQRAAAAATELLVENDASATAVLHDPLSLAVDPETGDLLDGEVQTMTTAQIQVPAYCAGNDWCEPSVWDSIATTSQPSVVSPSDLDVALGARVSEQTRAAFAAGSVVVTDPQWLTANDTIAFNEWRANDVYQPQGPVEELPDAVATRELDAILVETPWAFSAWRQVYVSPAAAASLGIEHAPTRVIGAYDGGPTDAQFDAIVASADERTAAHLGDEVPLFLDAYVPTGPPEAAGWLWLILGAVSVLVVAATAVAIGLSRVERRPDDATLSAVGARPGTRRAVSAWQALIIAGVGCLTGTIAGLMPVLGVAFILDGTTGGGLSFAEIPWGYSVLLALTLPIAIAIASFIVPLYRADLTRRTAIA